MGNKVQVAIIQAEQITGGDMVVVGLLREGGIIVAATIPELEIIEQSPE